MSLGTVASIAIAISVLALTIWFWRARRANSYEPNASNNWKNPNYVDFVDGDELRSSSHVPAQRSDQNFTGSI